MGFCWWGLIFMYRFFSFLHCILDDVFIRFKILLNIKYDLCLISFSQLNKSPLFDRFIRNTVLSWRLFNFTGLQYTIVVLFYSRAISFAFIVVSFSVLATHRLVGVRTITTLGARTIINLVHRSVRINEKA